MQKNFLTDAPATRARAITHATTLFVFVSLPIFSETVKGRVTDYDTQAPIAGVKVIALSSDSTQTAQDGSFGFTFAPASIGSISRQGHGQFRAGKVGDENATKVKVTYTLRNLRGATVGEIRPGDVLRSKKGLRGQYAPGLFIEPHAWNGGMSNFTDPNLSASLAKSAAVHRLAFEAEGYMRAVQQINGSHDSMLVRLKKGNAPTQLAQLTWYTSYPDPNSEECVKYNGCTWAGQFAALNGKQPESWVKANNIAAVHEKDFAAYKLKTLRITQGFRQIDVVVYDMCSDSDCNGCCTQNAKPTGFLIDIESHTAERFESGSGQVAWTCLDCD